MMRYSGLLLLLLGTSCASYDERVERPDHWATPMAIEGVPNLHRVSDKLYRSAQPTPEGMKNLEELGVRTVINLRANSDDDDEIAGTSLRQIRIPMNAWSPSREHSVRYLSVINGGDDGPYLVHCKHGADRTGSMVALYRVKMQGWETDQAIEEMKFGGFGFHKIWQDLVSWTREEADRLR